MQIPYLEMVTLTKFLSKNFAEMKLICSSGKEIYCGFINKSCSEVADKLDDIIIKLSGDLYFYVPPDDYLVDKIEHGVPVCYLGILGIDSKYYILGDSFLRTFISIYDFESSRVGLVVHNNSTGKITS